MENTSKEIPIKDVNSLILMLGQLSGKLDEIIAILSRIERDGVKTSKEKNIIQRCAGWLI